MLDTKGPEIRIGEIRDKIHIKKGDDFIMTTDIGVYEDTGKISVNYKAFSKDVDVGDIIVIDSGIVQAKAIEKHGEDIKFKVISGDDDLTTKKHINLYGKKVSLPSVTEQDWKDIDFGIEKKSRFYSIKFRIKRRRSKRSKRLLSKKRCKYSNYI
jgi:pyruvate kinase